MKFLFHGEELTIVEHQYVAGGTRLDIIGEDGGPYAVLTKHDTDGLCGENEFLVKTCDENTEIAAAAKQFFNDTGRRVGSSYYVLEIWKLKPVLTAACFDTQDKGEMPPHMAEWGTTPATYENWQAMWASLFRREHPIVGCPLGTGRSELAAKKDLIARTNAESKTSFELSQG